MGYSSIRERRMTRSARSANSSASTHAPRSIAIAARSASATAAASSASQLEALLGDVGEKVVGLVDLARQPLRQRVEAAMRSAAKGSRARASGPRSSASARILATPRSATHGTQDGPPGVDRGAAVGQGAFVAGAFGRFGPTLRLRRPALGRGVERAEHGDRRVPLQRPVAAPASRASARRSPHGRSGTRVWRAARPAARPGRRRRPPARSRSPPPGCPFASHQSAARASSRGTSSGSARTSSARSNSRKRWW